MRTPTEGEQGHCFPSPVANLGGPTEDVSREDGPLPSARPAARASVSRRLYSAAHRSYFEWLLSLDPSSRRSPWSLRGVVSSFVVFSTGMAIAAWVPGPREVFQLKAGSAFVALVPTVLAGCALHWFEWRRGMSLGRYGALVLTGMILCQSYLWSLVAFSSVPGAAVMATFPILLTALNGYRYRASFRHPFSIMASLVAQAVGLGLNWDPPHLAVFAVAAPMALGAHLVLGHFACEEGRQRSHQTALRSALDATLLAERSREVESLSSALLELRGHHHDAASSLSGLALNLQHLARMARTDGRKLEQAAGIADDLVAGLRRLEVALCQARDAGGASAIQAQRVVPVTVIRSVVDAARERYPGVLIEVGPEEGLAGEALWLTGGEAPFARALNNVVANACEGDGRKGAANVVVSWRALSDAAARVEVLDDGPGFKESQLGPLQLFQTTKPKGAGLGLYTAERLILTAGGRLTRGNRTDGAGAFVYLDLPRSGPAARPGTRVGVEGA